MFQRFPFLSILLVSMCIHATAWGWGGPTHANISNKVLDHPKIQAWLQHFGFTSSDRATMVSTASGEPDKATYQTSSWNTIKNRQFHQNQGVVNSGLTWAFSPFHVGVLLHLAGDASVPIGHSPARYYWNNPDGPGTAGAEAGQEFKTWSIPAITEYPGATYAENIDIHEAIIADIAQRYEAAFGFNSEIYEFLDSGGYNAPFFAEATNYPAPLGVVILDDYFKYHNDGPIGQVTVLSPNGGESLIAGSTQTITWQSQGEFQNIFIQYSTNNGTNWIPIATVADTGSYDWTVPALHSTQCLIRLSDTEYTNKNDASDSVFTIYTCTLVSDLDGDCCVDIKDLVILADSWLQCNDPDNLDCR